MTASLGPSPLYAPVRIAWPLPYSVPATRVTELTAWLARHQLPHNLAEVTQVAIGPDQLQVRFRPPRDVLGPWASPLNAHPPAAMLVDLANSGVLVCCAVVHHPDETERWRCTLRVDAHGRHNGSHVDGTERWRRPQLGDDQHGDDAEWPNGNPSDAPPPQPALAATSAPGTSRPAIRTVLAATLDLCDHDPAEPSQGCPRCPAITRVAAAIHAMIGATE